MSFKDFSTTHTVPNKVAADDKSRVAVDAGEPAAPPTKAPDAATPAGRS